MAAATAAAALPRSPKNLLRTEDLLKSTAAAAATADAAVNFSGSPRFVAGEDELGRVELRLAHLPARPNNLVVGHCLSCLLYCLSYALFVLFCLLAYR